MKKFEKIVPDTSVIIEGVLSKKLVKDYQVDEVLIHVAVVAELEHQANQEKAIGYLGLDELQALRYLADKGKIQLMYKGKKPSAVEIKYASLGEIDSMIRELAYEEGATLITADKVQFKVAEVRGIAVEYVQAEFKIKKLMLEKFFDEKTMSVHLKEGVFPYAKKGFPGAWEFVQVDKTKVTQEALKDISREIIEEAKKRRDSFIEIERPGSTIIQLGSYRIVILRPPFSDGWEITAVKPVKKLSLPEYKLSDKLKQRFESHAEGVLISGAPGHGKTTFASALALNYLEKGKIVKTIEAPRDLVLPPEITQLAMSHGDEQEIHDILLLSRPDYTFFDEMRNTKDFLLFSDLRLSGIGLVGVMHATKPIDAIQRFVGRIELGVIPHIVDTVVFIKDGQVDKVLSLEMTVNVPSGMTEEDLARPIVSISDFESGKIEYELYSYGEETVVIPCSKVEKVSPIRDLAAREIERFMADYASKVKVVMKSDHRAEVYVPTGSIAKIIGQQGKNVNQLEKQLGVSLDIRELVHLSKEGNTKTKETVPYNFSRAGMNLNIRLPREYSEGEADIYVEGRLVMTVAISKKGVIKVRLGSKMGKALFEDIKNKRNVEVKV